MKRKGIEPVVAILILLIISVVAGVAIYGFTSGMISVMQPKKSIGAITIVTAGFIDNRTEVSVVNEGSVNVTFPQKSLLIFEDNELIATGSLTSSTEVIKPGEAKVLSYYFDRPPPPRKVVIKVISSDGSSAAISVIISPSTKLRVTTANTFLNPSEDEDEDARYRAYCTLTGGNYRIYVAITIKKDPYVQGWIYGELFDKNGEHPSWVGSNPCYWYGTYWKGGMVSWWWEPVSPTEMPVTAVIKIYG